MGDRPPFVDELWELMRMRRDVRHFSREPVPSALLERVLQAAHLAPSVGLSQPWRFVLVDDPARRQAVIAEFERENQAAAAAYPDERRDAYLALKLAGLREAPVHLLVCCEPDPTQGHGLGRRTQPETVRDSAVCAVQNLWLFARALGLGVGWVSILDPARLAAALELPAGWRWVGYLCLGWPTEVSARPELEARGWEQRRSLEEVLLRR